MAQTPDARPAFEAASVKLNAGGANSSRTDGSKGQIVMLNQTLRRLVERAYNVKPFQVTGPDWMENVRFDVMAKYPPDTKSEDRPAMLRTLLEDRFKLSTHRESKEMPGYALVVAKGGLKLKAVDADKDSGTDSNSSNSLVTLKVTAVSMKELADYLARRLGSAVIDGTGADGVYTFELLQSSPPSRTRYPHWACTCRRKKCPSRWWWWITWNGFPRRISCRTCFSLSRRAKLARPAERLQHLDKLKHVLQGFAPMRRGR